MSLRFADLIPLSVPKVSSPDRKRGSHVLQDEVATLFDQFRDPLLRYLSSFGLTIQDGEEILQDVFLSLFEQLAQGKSVQNVRGWLFRASHNLALRRRYRLRRDGDGQTGEYDQEWTADPNPNPEERLAFSQKQERMRAVVAALSEQDRRCLILRAEGLRYREIAQTLNVSLGAVSISLARSLARIARSCER